MRLNQEVVKQILVKSEDLTKVEQVIQKDTILTNYGKTRNTKTSSEQDTHLWGTSESVQRKDQSKEGRNSTGV